RDRQLYRRQFPPAADFPYDGAAQPAGVQPPAAACRRSRRRARATVARRRHRRRDAQPADPGASQGGARSRRHLGRRSDALSQSRPGADLGGLCAQLYRALRMTTSLFDRIGIDIGRKLPLEDAVAWAAANAVRYVDIQLDTGRNALGTIDSPRATR